MSGVGLSAVLNDLASGRAGLIAQTLVRSPPLCEFDIFLQQDALLADLNRAYLDAKSHHRTVRHEHGAESPMADIAADLEDSAWCAMQTRLMELRRDGELMRFVQKTILDEQRAEAEKQREDQARQALDVYNRLEAIRLIKEKNKAAHIYEWLAMIIIFHRFLRLPFPALGVQTYRAAA